MAEVLISPIVNEVVVEGAVQNVVQVDEGRATITISPTPRQFVYQDRDPILGDFTAVVIFERQS